MGNHGLLILGDSVSDTFNRMYYFERAAETYIKALQTREIKSRSKLANTKVKLIKLKGRHK